ncbi:hypothetical protein HCTV-8_gp33 [Haloarcula virus HCTV-8]|uniref:Uncharacterized protein n=3 Tax=Haloferacalesvirus hv5 TaxID=1273753 RepID=A0AAE9BVQ0_9CAUD|nr:hypothetical protein HCTV-7_gp33 [Haloarcula phage HCTV-7]UBF20474.1 hypothetical protein HCTV-9_gp33 [Haloarcula phage HCTV-9]UBF20590.1 hypothetical protein HCTV-11_gp33 [Haloarcula phage HCTV-11]UBF20932.1 hypothetical protein HCTV-8_gp33 [Haloarcula virus HCTV-8]UBF21044.1 hypothetical protein HCTV-10_gp33 [Haloarcula virus HCTV-10]
MEKIILYIPDDDGEYPVDDPRVDEVRTDPETDTPYIKDINVPDEGEFTLNRLYITQEKKDILHQAISEYETETAKTDPDPQIQIATLEKAISNMWDVVSGEDIGSALPDEQTESTDTSSDGSTTTDDSTSA